MSSSAERLRRYSFSPSCRTPSWNSDPGVSPLPKSGFEGSVRLISGEARSSTANGMPRAASWSRTRGRPLGHEVLPVAEIVERRLRAAVLGGRQRAPEQELLGVLRRGRRSAWRRPTDAARPPRRTPVTLRTHCSRPAKMNGSSSCLQGVAKRTAAHEAGVLQDAHLLELARRERARQLVVVEEGVVLSSLLAGTRTRRRGSSPPECRRPRRAAPARPARARRAQIAGEAVARET